MFPEFDPVDVTRVDSWIPAFTAVEEEILLIRRDSRSVFIILGINLWTHIPGLGPGPIRPSQGEVQVRFRSELCSWFNGVEHHKGFIWGNSRTVASYLAHLQRDHHSLSPGVVYKRGNHKRASSVWYLVAVEVDTVVRC